jgi:outer membrane receptor for ferrienterochelin and colicin
MLSVIVMLSLCQLSYAQKNISAKDSTVSFKVFGVCDQCKDRIEKAAKGKGVRSAVWDVDTKMLLLAFNPKLTSIEKVQDRIVAVGHDLENKKADDAVYKNLPSCCHYRELLKEPQEMKMDDMSSMTDGDMKMDQSMTMNDAVKGIVLEEDKNGSFKPLIGASVIWLGTNKGTTTDTAGIFSIPHQPNSKLVISYAGYQPDTLTVSDMYEMKVVLASGKQLSEVTITNRQRSSYMSAINPIRTQVMTQRELFKAACCNLSESFETNASVDVSYNDAVTGSKQIQLLGLAGNYTQLTVENLPGPRGIATAWGLNSIPGTWVESIQLSKGVGSVANGYESIAGQINVELKKPENCEKFFSNIYVNDQGKTDLNFNIAQKISSKWSAGLLLHGDFFNNKNLDFNNDGFRDLPTGHLLTAMNRWKYDDGKGFMTQFGFKILNDQKTGGQVDFDPSTDKFTTNHYGLGINTKRYEGFSKIGYIFPGKKYKSVGLQLSAFDHRQDSYFGLTKYNARQQNFYGNLIYQSIIGTTVHKFRTGLSFVSDHYNEDFNAINFKRTESVPGAFFEYTFTPVDQFNIVAGIREDHNSLFGWFTTPRLHIRYEPVKGTTIRLSAGRGQRTANIFAENNSVLVSSRQVEIITSSNGKAYGFDPEVAWNKGISVDQKFKLFTRDASFSIDFFRNDFQKQVVVDLEDPRKVRFYELNGRSYSNSLQSELDFTPADKLDIRLAYRFFDVKETYGDQLLEKPLLSKNRAFLNAAYEIKGWKLDYTFNFNGRKRIPNTSGNPLPYQRNAYSPAYVLMNAQISKSLGKQQTFDVYVGGENLTGYYQKDAIIAADQPFSPYFDASLVWGPLSGRMFYAGMRFKVK